MLTERRSYRTEVEVRRNGSKPVIAGYAAMFGKMSKPLSLGPRSKFVESIDTRAFNETMKNPDNVVGLVNHDPDKLLGRVGAGTVRLSVDTRGLAYEIDPPDTTYARDLLSSLERGDAAHSSFGFRVVGDEGEAWDYLPSGQAHRSLLNVQLFDVSPLTHPPAYEATTARLDHRSFKALCELRGIPMQDLSAMTVDEACQALLDEEALKSALGTTEVNESAAMEQLAESVRALTERFDRLVSVAFPEERREGEEAYEARGKYNADQLKQLKAEGKTLPDGSFPIADEEDVKDAIRLTGLGNASSETVRKWIIKRAAALGVSNLVPPAWNADGSKKADRSAEDEALEWRINAVPAYATELRVLYMNTPSDPDLADFMRPNSDLTDIQNANVEVLTVPTVMELEEALNAAAKNHQLIKALEGTPLQVVDIDSGKATFTNDSDTAYVIGFRISNNADGTTAISFDGPPELAAAGPVLDTTVK